MRWKISLYVMTVLVLMLILFVVVCSISIYRYYYNGIVRDIELHIETVTRFFSKYSSIKRLHFD